MAGTHGDGRYLIGLRGLIHSATLDQNKDKTIARKMSDCNFI